MIDTVSDDDQPVIAKSMTRADNMKSMLVDEFKRLVGSKRQLHKAMSFQGK